MESLTVASERVDDMPVLAAQVERTGLAGLLDAHFPTHGGWAGLTLGGTAAVWLTHVLSPADHRLSHVPPWAERRLATLGGSFAFLGQAVRALDVADDRLAAVLEALSDDGRWVAFEAALTGRRLRVYDLPGERVRLDTTTASGHWQVTPEGLFQFGHSKDHRPDLPQLKVIAQGAPGRAGPAGAAGGHRRALRRAGRRPAVPAGACALARVREGVGRAGLLYSGCTWGTARWRPWRPARAWRPGAPPPCARCPLARCHPLLWMSGWRPSRAASRRCAPSSGGGPTVRWSPSPKATNGRRSGPRRWAGWRWRTPRQWPARRLLVRSLAHAQAAETAWRARLAKAQAALATVTERAERATRRHDAQRAPAVALQQVLQAAAAILAPYRVAEVLHVTCTEHRPVQTVPAWDGRPATVPPCPTGAPRRQSRWP